MERLADHHHGNYSICRCFLVKFFIQSELFLEGVNFCFLTRVKIYSIKYILKTFHLFLILHDILKQFPGVACISD